MLIAGTKVKIVTEGIGRHAHFFKSGELGKCIEASQEQVGVSLAKVETKDGRSQWVSKEDYKICLIDLTGSLKVVKDKKTDILEYNNCRQEILDEFKRLEENGWKLSNIHHMDGSITVNMEGRTCGVKSKVTGRLKVVSHE